MNSEKEKTEKSKIFKLLTAVFILVVMGLLSTGCGSEKDNGKKLVKATFEMDMVNSKGEKVSMEEFKGNVIFLNIWATWCPPCIEEMPTIHNLHEEIGETKIKFVMLSMNQDFEKAIKFRNDNGYKFEVYRLEGPMPALYHTKLIPTTFVINSEGYVELQHDGAGQFDTEEFTEFLSGVE